MGILKRLFPFAGPDGLRLVSPRWELEIRADFSTVLRALPQVFPESAVIYFEGGYADGHLLCLLKKHQLTNVPKIALGTYWPKTSFFHLPMNREILEALAVEMTSRATPELAIHFHVYDGNVVLFEWHDAFSQPALLSAVVEENTAQRFAELVKGDLRPFDSEAAKP